MKIEHLTYLGNSVIRDSLEIAKETNLYFNVFNGKDGEIEMETVKNTDGFSIEAQIDRENKIATFVILKKGKIISFNFCGLGNKQNAFSIFKDVINSLNNNDKIFDLLKLKTPKYDNFIYTIVLGNPFEKNGITIADLTIAGEIELYIYYAIYKE